MSFDPSDYRQKSRRNWGSVAGGWAKHADRMRDASMPVAMRMVDLARLQPGHSVLELAAGTGDTGFLAAETVRPGGTLICSDFAPEMLSVAQQRAEALGLDNVRFKQIDAESIDIHAASIDAVLCRWAFMLMADPGAALRECRRILRPGGRLVLATWAGPEDNPWASLVNRELVARNFLELPPEGAPGQFAWADPAAIEEHIADAGFVDEIAVEPVDVVFADPDFDAFWRSRIEMSTLAGDALRSLPADQLAELETAVRGALSPFARPDGSYAIPGRALVASATA